MADKWIIKPTGANQLDVTLPDRITVDEEVASIAPQSLLRALAEWVALQEVGGKSGDKSIVICWDYTAK